MPDDEDDDDDLDEDEDEDDGDDEDGEDDDGYDLDGGDDGHGDDDDGEAKKVEITLADIERLIRSHAPDLAEMLKAFLEQADPRPPGGVLPEGAIDFHGLQRLIAQARSTVNEDERRTRIADAWRRFLSQTNPPPPPRFLLADLLVKLYDEGTEPGRAALLELAAGAELKYGLWG